MASPTQVNEAVRRVDLQDDPVPAFPASQAITERALGLDPRFFDENGRLLTSARRSVRRVRTTMSVTAACVTAVLVLAGWLASSPETSVTLYVTAMITFAAWAAVGHSLGDPEFGERLGDRDRILHQARYARRFQRAAASALRDGYDEQMVQEAALAANGDLSRFTRILKELT